MRAAPRLPALAIARRSVFAPQPRLAHVRRRSQDEDEKSDGDDEVVIVFPGAKAAPAPASAPAPAPEGIPEELECVVCMDAKKDTLLMPCKHACVCSACAEDLLQSKSDCPQCRKAIGQVIKIFL